MSFHTLPRPARRATVSVVVPCYRYGHYLETAVGSVLSQEDVRTEVIVVDDASPDDSADVVRRLAAEHPQVTGVVHETNKGHIATYNDGLARATGDYVLLLSADDALSPGALARAVGIMQKHPRVGLVYGFAPSFEDELLPARSFLPHCTVWTGDEWLERVCRSGQNPVSTPTAVMRRDVLEAAGGYDAKLPHTADLLMWLRSAAHADVAYVNGADQAQYRVHGSNMHMTAFAQLRSDLEQRREAFRAFATELGDDDPYARRLLGLAVDALVAEALAARRRLLHGTPVGERAAGVTAAPEVAEAVASLEDFADRYAPGGLRSGTRRVQGALDRWTSVGDRVGWYYWRRSGLRL